MVVFSLLPDLVIPKQDFYSCIVDQIKKQGDKVAIIDASNGRQLSFREIHNASIKLASALTRRGLQKQEVVALCSSNCIEYSTIVLGVSACNAITTTCNPNYTLVETQKQLENCKPKFVITDSDQVEKMLEIAKLVTSIEEVISVDFTPRCPSLWSLIENDDGSAFPFHTTFNVYDDVVILPYSSGTTGLPKGVMLTHYNVVAITQTMSGYENVVPGTVKYCSIPMFHIYGFNYIFSNFRGSKFIVDKRFRLKSFFEAVEKYKITYVSSVPAALKNMSNSPLAKNYDLSSLRSVTSGGAALASSVVAETMQKMQAVVAQGWGMTESGGVNSVAAMIGVPSNTVGKIIPNCSIKVVDPITREELGVNQDGELLFRGPGVMKGYYNNPKANASVFECGWLCTGDIGHYDEHGFVFLTERMKELIKYKGFQVAPAELEGLLLEHPKVRDVGVVGIPDRAAGEVPRAFVVREDKSVTAEDLQHFIESKVSTYKRLRGGVYFLDDIPRSVTGKILRRSLAKISVPTAQSKL